MEPQKKKRALPHSSVLVYGAIIKTQVNSILTLNIKINGRVFAVCVTTRLRAGRPRNWGSIPETGKSVLCPSVHTDNFLGPASILFIWGRKIFHVAKNRQCVYVKRTVALDPLLRYT